MRKSLLIGLLLCIAGIGFSQTFQQSGLVSTSGTSGSAWVAPVGILFSKDGERLFVWEKRGRVYVCNRNAATGQYVKQETPVIDISEEVGDWWDHGLLGFSLDPLFASNGRIYLLYVVDRHYLLNKDHGQATYSASANDYYKATIGRVTRYETTVSSNNLVATASSRKVLIGETKSTGMPILHQSHGVGSLLFASDGTLLVTMGDGACYNHADEGSDSDTYFAQALTDGIITQDENVGAFRSQMLNSHNGKLLRVNPENGDGMSSNPFFEEANPRSPRSRVWALGFRNPFRAYFKAGTGSTNPSAADIGEIFVGDVGWRYWEEVNVVKTKGMNFGWPLYEGQTTETDYQAKNTQNKEEPNSLFNSGACSRPYFRFKELLRQDNAAQDKKVYNPCDNSVVIGQDIRHIHARPIVDWRHGQNLARVPKFEANGNASWPTIGTQASGVAGDAFRGNSSSGGTWFSNAAGKFPAAYTNTFMVADYQAGWIRRFSMDYTDVITKSDPIATGAGAVVCLAENPLDGGLYYVNYSGSAVSRIMFGGNMPPVAKIVADTTYGPASSLQVSFTGNTSFDPTPGGSISSYSWHFGGISGNGNSNTSSQANPVRTFSATPGTPKKFIVKLTVTDNQGATAADSIIVSVNNTPPVVKILSPVHELKYQVGVDTTYKLEASVTDNEHQGSQLSYAWQTTLRHNEHEHPGNIDPAAVTGARVARIGCNGEMYYWLVNLTVTDAAGLSATDSSKIYPDCAGTLPLFLHKFSVNPQSGGNYIRWSTQLESNMEYFEVERSTDGINFMPVNQQPCRNTAGTNEYSYTDRTAPSGTTVYYRLKMVEHGNIIRYSTIIRLMQENAGGQLMVSPNPVVDNFSVSFSSKSNSTALVTIHDMNGAVVLQTKETVSKGSNVMYVQNKAEWTAGVYVVSVEIDGQVFKQKFIKAGK